MSHKQKFFDQWKTDYDFRTLIGAFGSFAATVFFALYNGYYGITRSSLWYGAICIYYIILVAIRGIIIAAERNAERNNRGDLFKKRVHFAASSLLLFLNIALIGPIALMIRMEKPTNMTLIPAIVMAAYTTGKVIAASVNFKRKKQSGDCLVKLLRSISFIDALVSILSLQNTLIMVNAVQKESMLLLMILTSSAIWLIIMSLSLYIFVKSVNGLKLASEEAKNGR